MFKYTCANEHVHDYAQRDAHPVGNTRSDPLTSHNAYNIIILYTTDLYIRVPTYLRFRDELFRMRHSIIEICIYI